jgi:hypothetical protein
MRNGLVGNAGRAVAVCALWWVTGCSAGTAVPEEDQQAGPVAIGDAGVPDKDAGTQDAGTQDAGTQDTGAQDAGATDAGTPGDASGTDAGVDAVTEDVPANPLAPLSINEIAAQGTPLPGGFNPTGGDWVELYNSQGTPVDLTGYRIASVLKPFAQAHPLPPGTTIAAKGFLVIYFNLDNAGSPVINDKLKGSTDSSLQLWTPDAKVVDSVTWKATQVIKGGSLGRTPDGANSWKLYAKPDATPGKPNK